MGNCQATSADAIEVEHPSGKKERYYWPLLARQLMLQNPGHYVALFSHQAPEFHTAGVAGTSNTASFFGRAAEVFAAPDHPHSSSSSLGPPASSSSSAHATKSSKPARRRSIRSRSARRRAAAHQHQQQQRKGGPHSPAGYKLKLMPPDAALVLGSSYRLVTFQEAMKLSHGRSVSSSSLVRDFKNKVHPDVSDLPDSEDDHDHDLDVCSGEGDADDEDDPEEDEEEQEEDVDQNLITTLALQAAYSRTLGRQQWRPALQSIAEAGW